MMLIGKPTGQSHFGQGNTILAHKEFRALHAPVEQKLIRRLARAPAKAANEV
jgi:hypothetical protein